MVVLGTVVVVVVVEVVVVLVVVVVVVEVVVVVGGGRSMVYFRGDVKMFLEIIFRPTSRQSHMLLQKN